MTELTARSLRIAEDPGSNAVISSNFYLLLAVCGNDKNNEKDAGNGPFQTWTFKFEVSKFNKAILIAINSVQLDFECVIKSVFCYTP